VVPVLIVILSVTAALYAWLAGASAIFCIGLHHSEWLMFPFDQWIDAARLFRRVGWNVRAWIVLSAAMPSVFLLIVVAVVLRAWPRRQPQSWQQVHTGPQGQRQSALYGKSRLVTVTDLERNDLILK
jgi:hypothetical protein